MKNGTKRSSTEFSRLLKSWRTANHKTVRAAAEEVAVAASTWSDLENGNRQPELETLVALSRVIGTPMADLARMANLDVRLSQSTEDRAHRLAAVAEAIPQMATIVDLLPEFSPAELDTVLSVMETIVRRRG